MIARNCGTNPSLVASIGASPILSNAQNSQDQSPVSAHSQNQTQTQQTEPGQPRARSKTISPPQAQHESKPNTPKNEKSWLDGWSVGDEIAFVVALIAFGQFVALVATYLMMAGSAKRQLRAYVFVNTDLSRRRDGIVKVRLKLANFGQTPAYQMRDGSKVWIDTYPHPAQSTEPTFDEIPACLGPSDDLTVWDDVEISDSDCDEIENGSKALWASVRVTYRDAFNKRWETVYLGFAMEERFTQERKLEVRRYDAT
jgi:hypothetical protein